jgi:hypothetical protein
VAEDQMYLDERRQKVALAGPTLTRPPRAAVQR